MFPSSIGGFSMDAKAMYLNKLVEIVSFLSKVTEVLDIIRRASLSTNDMILENDVNDAISSIDATLDDLQPYIKEAVKQCGPITIPLSDYNQSTNKPVVIIKSPILSSKTKH